MKVFKKFNFLCVFIPWYNWYNKFLATKKALNEFKLFFIRTFGTAENSYKYFFVEEKIQFFINLNKIRSLL
jgi:hypothetical protein